MGTTGVLYGFELRKIARRKIVWISSAIILVILVVTLGSDLVGSYYIDGEKVDSNYHRFQEDKAYQEALDGRLIDNDLLGEMVEAYREIPVGADRYSLTEEYQLYARPYSIIFNFVSQATGMTAAQIRNNWQGDEEDLYAKRLEWQEKSWDMAYLTEAEKAFWREKENVEWPVEFRYMEGYRKLFYLVQTAGLAQLLLIAICLSGVFAEEHARKTDQLILSSRYGRKRIYWVKFAAGISFSLMLSLAFTVILFLAAFVMYGADGFLGAFQLLYGIYPLAVSIGEVVLGCFFIVTLAVTLTGIFVMLLSELFRSSIGALSLTGGLLILGTLFEISGHYRVLSQIWSYFPAAFVAPWNILDFRLIPIFGEEFMAWQVVPVVYCILGVILVLIGKRAFRHYQVKGR